MGAHKRSNEEWRALIADQRNSGLSQSKWCAANCINVYTFRDRARRLNNPDRGLKPQVVQPNTASTVWMEIIPESVLKKATGKPVGISIERDGFMVTVNAGFDAELLTEVLKAVSQAC